MIRRAAILFALLLMACHHRFVAAEGAPSFPLSSAAFQSGTTIPTRFTCDGPDVSPPMAWSGAPKTDRLIVVVNDTSASGGLFVHWIADLPAGSVRLAEGRLPPGSVQGTNSFGHRRYEGPCPPHGDPLHHYTFSVYAVPSGRTPSPTIPPADALKKIAPKSVGIGRMFGTYGR